VTSVRRGRDDVGLGATAEIFGFADEQLEFRDTVLEFARRDLADASADPDGPFSHEAWRRCADFGIQGLPVPEEHGGSGAAPSTVVLALEALGYACRNNGLLFSLNAQMWACEEPLAKFGSDDQKRRYLQGLCDGTTIAAHAMSEPASGSDAFALASSAVKTADGYRLNGSKTFVTNGPVADLFLVFARTRPEGGFGGISAFLVERDTPGLEVGKPLGKMGLTASPMAELFLDDCLVPPSQLLGAEGAGMAVFTASMRLERSCILATAVGAMQHQFEASRDYARERRQFGQPIGAFQAISHRLVEMRLRLDTARLMLYRLARLLDEGQAAELEAALTKLHISEAYVASSLDAIQLRGGYGYLTEYGAERELRDAIGGRLYSGTSEIQRNLAARALGLAPRVVARPLDPEGSG
jgi:alkylation response protein AidB-like acyl-CoA dehydrogenase